MIKFINKKEGLFSGALIYLISNILNASIPFILLPILTRNLEPAEYGQVAMFQVLISALTAFVGLNTVGAANRKFYDSDADSKMPYYIGACVQILGLSFLIVVFLLFCFRGWLSIALDLPPNWVVLAAVASAATYIVQLRLGQWQVRRRPFKYGAMQLSLSLFNAVLSIFLVVILSMGPEGRMIGQTLAPLMLCCVALYLLLKDELLKFTFEKEFIKDALRFGVPLIPHIGGAFLLFTIDRFIINKQLGLEAAGLYMVAVQLTMAMSILFDAFNKAYIPWLYERLKNNYNDEKKKIVKWTYFYFFCALLLAFLVLMLGPYIVVILAGEEYLLAGEVIGTLALGQAFRGMYLMVTNYIFYAKCTARLSYITIFSGVLNIFLILALVPKFGLQGAAQAFMLAMAFMFFATWRLAQLSHPMPWLEFWRRDH